MLAANLLRRPQPREEVVVVAGRSRFLAKILVRSCWGRGVFFPQVSTSVCLSPDSGPGHLSNRVLHPDVLGCVHPG